ncbi:MAG: response regulator [Granulosicoccus sp.]|nr:response regulator [Granulosicoccus sp.]
MTEPRNFLFDVLGLIGGGRGDALNSLTPHLLGALMWGAFCVYVVVNQCRSRQPGDALLLWAVSFSFLVELGQLTVVAMTLHGSEVVSLTMPAWLMTKDALIIGSRILMAAVFLRLLLPNLQLASSYLAMATGLWLIASLFQMLTSTTYSADLMSVRFGELPAGWVMHLSGILIISFAIVMLARSSRRIRKPVIAGLVMLWLDSLLALSWWAGEWAPATVINPLRGNLALWAIPFFAYALLRVRQVSEKRQEHSLQNLERLKALGQLSSGIAHDFNNHLQIILGYVELARNQDNRPTVALDRIEQAADAAGALVNQLLTFSRGQKTEFTVLDLNEIIMKTSPMIARLLGPHIRLMHDLDFNAGPIYADSRMIEQVLFNLVVNARDAMPGGGTISILTRRIDAVRKKATNNGSTSGGGVRISIADTGSGMDKETLRRSFEPFYTTKPVGQGTGLGLATVYGIVQEHGASIRIDSKPGDHTHVHIDFPAASGTVDERTDEIEPTLRGKGETILLVEDEAAIRDLACTLLNNAGYQVLIANDGQHAINIVGTYYGVIDLCLFDVIMPRLSGYQTYDRIQGSGNSIPVLFITGGTSRAGTLRRQYPHLQKPFTGNALLDAIHKVLHATVNH